MVRIDKTEDGFCVFDNRKRVAGPFLYHAEASKWIAQHGDEFRRVGDSNLAFSTIYEPQSRNNLTESTLMLAGIAQGPGTWGSLKFMRRGSGHAKVSLLCM